MGGTGSGKEGGLCGIDAVPDVLPIGEGLERVDPTGGTGSGKKGAKGGEGRGSVCGNEELGSGAVGAVGGGSMGGMDGPKELEVAPVIAIVSNATSVGTGWGAATAMEVPTATDGAKGTSNDGEGEAEGPSKGPGETVGKVRGSEMCGA